jgi:hypothetical protein
MVTQLGDGAEAGNAVRALVEQVKLEFERGNFKNSGLAGAFRAPARGPLRKLYLNVLELAFDLLYLLGEAFTQFQRISDCLGDYGSIRISAWLHPFLDALSEKVQAFTNNLTQLNGAVDEAYVLARARGKAVEKPAPSNTMCTRAHAAVQRAVLGRSSHAQSLLQTIDALKVRSAPDRLPRVMEGLGDACSALQTVLNSSEFRARIGESFPELPPLCRIEAGPVALAPTPDFRLLDLDAEDLRHAEEPLGGAAPQQLDRALPPWASKSEAYACGAFSGSDETHSEDSTVTSTVASPEPTASNASRSSSRWSYTSRSASCPRSGGAQGARKRSGSRPPHGRRTTF